MIEKVAYSRQFKKSVKKLPSRILILAEKKIKIFLTDPFHVNLKTHPLHGMQKGVWFFSINQNYRILFNFHTAKSIIFQEIGTHQIYKK